MISPLPFLRLHYQVVPLPACLPFSSIFIAAAFCRNKNRCSSPLSLSFFYGKQLSPSVRCLPPHPLRSFVRSDRGRPLPRLELGADFLRQRRRPRHGLEKDGRKEGGKEARANISFVTKHAAPSSQSASFFHHPHRTYFFARSCACGDATRSTHKLCLASASVRPL